MTKAYCSRDSECVSQKAEIVFLGSHTLKTATQLFPDFPLELSAVNQYILAKAFVKIISKIRLSKPRGKVSRFTKKVPKYSLNKSLSAFDYAMCANFKVCCTRALSQKISTRASL